VVLQLQENLQLNQSSLEKPESETKGWIRCLAREAKSSNKLDVVKHLREIVPAGTTGKCEKDALALIYAMPQKIRSIRPQEIKAFLLLRVSL